MSEAEPNDAPAASVFCFTGRIGPKRYWAHIAGALAALIATVMFAATAMDPRGGGGAVFLAFPLFAVFVWVLAAAMTQRLRDAGKPPALALAFLLGLIAWLYLSIELIEVLPFGGLLGFFAILAVVGHIDTFIVEAKSRCRMTADRDITIQARWDDEANAWLATSEDVPGHVVEADTWPAMINEVHLVLPELLELSGEGGHDLSLTFRAGSKAF